MTEHGQLWGRRKLLTGAGLAAAAGAGIAILDDGPARAAQTAVTAINVKDAPYRATGDGKTDDRAAIQHALDDVGDSGGSVYFPPGDYRVNGPVVPRSRTLMFGGHVPRWGDNPPSPCKISMGGGFDGSGLIVPGRATTSVLMRNLALVGNNVGSGLHGLLMPGTDVAAGELSWVLDGVSIYGFSGDGIYGRMHVAILDGCFIHNNDGWGINASSGNNWNDVHVANCFLFYNKQGNLYFGGSKVSAGIDFVNCRFERAGTNPSDVLNPLKADSPGIRLASARLIEFVNCNTDANTGNGFEIVHEPDTPDSRPDNILFANCRLSRDGTGNQQSLGDFAGVKVKGAGIAGSDSANQIKFVNCRVSYGKASDSGSGTVLGPKYGVWYENTNHFQWIGGNIDASPQAADNDYYAGGASGGNNSPTIIDLERGLLTLPQRRPADALPKPDGLVYFEKATSRLGVWNGSEWRFVGLS